MDIKVSRKTTRDQPSGSLMVVMNDISDLYPIFDEEGRITDIEMLDNPRDELLDRSMWAAMKQRGGDPLNLLDGNQIEECILGEISPVVLIGQITSSIAAEGPGVQSSFGTSFVNGKEFLTIAILLTPSS